MIVKKLSNSVESIIDTVVVDVEMPTPFATPTATELNWSSLQELLFVGDTVWVELWMGTLIFDTIVASSAFDMDVTSGSSFFNAVTEQQIFEAADVYMNNFVPEIKMSEFVLGIFKMFNLYVTVDPLDETNLLIETRDEFYGGGTIRDWTKKLARDKEISLKPVGLLTAKEYIYTYSEDEDYYNERYQDSKGHAYGRRKREIDNDFLTNKSEVKVAFSPTPLINDGNSSRLVSKIYDSDIEEGRKPVDFNTRLLYYGGQIASAPHWIFRYNAGSTTETRIVYPYAGHLDNPLAPSLDLNFGIPKELYYTANGYTGTLLYTNANLFNVYHRAYIDEITDKDSKVMTGMFYLTPWDIAKLDFRDQILIDNAYWRINKVMDYNPFKDGLTTVELINVLELDEQETEIFTHGSQGAIGGTGNQEPKPTTGRKSLRQGNHAPEFQGTVKGKRNKIADEVRDFKVLGDENFIAAGSNRVTILGNRNKVINGANNVVIINTDGVTVAESNVTIIDGKRTWQYISKTAAYTAIDRDFILADASGGAFTITLPSVGDSEDVWINIKKTDSSANAVTVSPGVSGLIDGASTQTLPTQYDAIDLYCDGSTWHIR